MRATLAFNGLNNWGCDLFLNCSNVREQDNESEIYPRGYTSTNTNRIATELNFLLIASYPDNLIDKTFAKVLKNSILKTKTCIPAEKPYHCNNISQIQKTH